MKSIKIFVACAIAAVFISAISWSNKKITSDTNHKIISDGFAVLELFTSEGCSSCPPADELMASIQQQAGDKAVYVLAYHVDYWNRNGWKDGFSNSLFSDRQYEYSRLFSGQVYTPQVVVNGKTEFIGSDTDAAKKFVEKALSKGGSNILTIHGSDTGNSVKLDYVITGPVDDIKLMIAVVQKQATTNVKGGENKGRMLFHSQIVHDLQAFSLTANEGFKDVRIPAGFNKAEWELIGFLQNNRSGTITAATRVTFSGS